VDSGQQTFETLVAVYYESLYRFAYSLTKSADDGADLVQQTFLIWARKGQTLRDPDKAKSWLFTTLYREFLRGNRRNRSVQPIDQEMLEAREDTDTIDQVRQMEADEAVAALHQLDPVYRDPLTLFYMEDLSYKEIAAILDIPIGTVMSRLSRGKAQLKAALRQNSGNNPND
jgi:RNA polymerase sigma-70 factor (ECF subfamily)